MLNRLIFAIIKRINAINAMIAQKRHVNKMWCKCLAHAPLHQYKAAFLIFILLLLNLQISKKSVFRVWVMSLVSIQQELKVKNV